jgi:hypothetical protein
MPCRSLSSCGKLSQLRTPLDSYSDRGTDHQQTTIVLQAVTVRQNLSVADFCRRLDSLRHDSPTGSFLSVLKSMVPVLTDDEQAIYTRHLDYLTLPARPADLQPIYLRSLPQSEMETQIRL